MCSIQSIQQITRDTASSSLASNPPQSTTPTMSQQVVAAIAGVVSNQVITGVRPVSLPTGSNQGVIQTITTAPQATVMKLAAPAAHTSMVTTTSEVCNRSHGIAPSKQLTIATFTSTTSSITMASSSPTTNIISNPATSQKIIAHQQFTVHNQYPATLGSIAHTGPAPNVTVNPHYNPHLHHQVLNISSTSDTPATVPTVPSPSIITSDQQIRVLTPSEIMRTLPSLSQESYDTQVMVSPYTSSYSKTKFSICFFFSIVNMISSFFFCRIFFF